LSALDVDCAYFADPQKTRRQQTMSDVGNQALAPYRWVILAVAMLAGFIGSYAQFQLPPLAYRLIPMLLPEIGPVYAGSAGGIIVTLMVLGAVLIPTFIITPLAGSNVTVLFGLAALCFALLIIPALFLPELGSRALAARSQRDKSRNSVIS
jgi:hypothetical protein